MGVANGDSQGSNEKEHTVKACCSAHDGDTRKTAGAMEPHTHSTTDVSGY